MDFSATDFPFEGEVIWLTPEQGGRRAGPPTDTSSYATIAHIAPGTVQTDSASFVLRGWEPDQWRSPAEALWLFGDEVPQTEQTMPGSVISVTEGARLVAFFVVREVRGQQPS